MGRGRRRRRCGCTVIVPSVECTGGSDVELTLVAHKARGVAIGPRTAAWKLGESPGNLRAARALFSLHACSPRVVYSPRRPRPARWALSAAPVAELK